MPTQPFVIERTFNHPITIVWKAISDKGEMKKWYFDFAQFKLEIGFKFEFIGGDETKKYIHLCEITDLIPEKKLTYSWRYDGYEGISFVTFELIDEDGETKLRLTHEGLESFIPNNNPAFDSNNFVAGWTHIIGVSLKEFLES